jgi:tRNA (cmo5U34)-methyltransferase
MKNQHQKEKIVFDQERAAAYDKQNAKLAPMRDVLHLLTRAILSDLPATARILCVGVGTGLELLYLANEFPEWQFIAVEPSAPMLDVCRQRAEENGIAARCTFHEGYLDTLPATEAFDAATCFLVSHFILDSGERSNFFRQIAARLHPDAYLVSSDLASDISTSNYKSLLEVWIRTLKSSDWPNAERLREIYGRDVALLSTQEVETIIKAGGFECPVLFLQTALIHAWYSKRAA